MKKAIFFVALPLLLICLFAPDAVEAGTTGNVTATVIMQNVSVSITANGTFDYGTLSSGGSQDTVTLVKTIIASNDGNIPEKFNISGANTTGCVWTLGASAGASQYKHEFSTNGTFPGTALTAGYATLAASVPSSDHQDFDLKITVPTSSSCYTTATAVVTVQATTP